MTEKMLPDVSSVRIVTPPGRLQFPALLAPEPSRFDAEKIQFSAGLAMRKEDTTDHPAWKSLWATVIKYALNELGARAMRRVDDRMEPMFAHPGIIDGDAEGQSEYNRGLYIVRAKAHKDRAPVVLVGQGENRRRATEHDAELVYGGANALLTLGLYYYQGKSFGMGVSLQLLGAWLPGGGDPYTSEGWQMTESEAGALYDSAGALPAPEAAPQVEAKPAPAPADGEWDDDIPF